MSGARAAPQVDRLALSANGDPLRYAAFGLHVLPDSLPGQLGPLAGILSGLEWVRQTMPSTAWMASFAVDTPRFPLNLVARLLTAAETEGAEVAVALSQGRMHPVFALWPVSSAPALRHALIHDKVRAVQAWMDRFRVAAVAWDSSPDDPFFNINTPADLDQLASKEIDR